MTATRMFLAASATLLLGTCLLYPVFSRILAAKSDDEPTEIVYVDTKSAETFLIASRSSPEVNPTNGERTLIPAMYCPQCKAWKPVGPQENRQMRRSTCKCPIHRIPLTLDGPEPD